MTDLEAIDIVEGANYTDEEALVEVEAWQQLIDSGIVWHLQGWFGRTAQNLITHGICHAKEAE